MLMNQEVNCDENFIQKGSISHNQKSEPSIGLISLVNPNILWKCGYLYLSGDCLCVDLRVNTEKATCVYKRLDYVLKFVNRSKLNSQHNWGKPIWPFNEHKNLHFDNEYNIHIRSIKYEENGCRHDFDLLIISYLLHCMFHILGEVGVYKWKCLMKAYLPYIAANQLNP